MKTEGQFNAYLGKELKRFTPKLKVLKVADKFSVGISDFLIWANRRSCGIEAKFIKELPVRPLAKVLDHPFAGAQLTFLEDLNLAGSFGYGLVAVGSTEEMHLFMLESIPKTGNFTRQEFLRADKISFKFDQVPQLVDYLFGTLL